MADEIVTPEVGREGLTPLDKEYLALDPEDKKFVDAMGNRYASIIDNIGLSDDSKAMMQDGMRIMSKRIAIDYLKGRLDNAKEELADSTPPNSQPPQK